VVVYIVLYIIEKGSMSINFFSGLKWLLLLGLLYGDAIGGQGLSEVEENRVVMEELLARFERQERVRSIGWLWPAVWRC